MFYAVYINPDMTKRGYDETNIPNHLYGYDSLMCLTEKLSWRTVITSVCNIDCANDEGQMFANEYILANTEAKKIKQ